MARFCGISEKNKFAYGPRKVVLFINSKTQLSVTQKGLTKVTNLHCLKHSVHYTTHSVSLLKFCQQTGFDRKDFTKLLTFLKMLEKPVATISEEEAQLYDRQVSFYSFK